MANRRRQWQDFTINMSAASGAQDSETLLTGGIDDTKGMTIVRMIIGVHVNANTLIVGGLEKQAISMGIGMMSAEAIASSAFPDPNAQGDIPVTGWLWRWQGMITRNPEVLTRIDMDIRAMRKVMYGSPVLVMDNDPITGVPFSVQDASRYDYWKRMGVGSGLQIPR